MSSALIIFIKNPEKGKVKTRIAKTTGPDRALEIYNHLLNHTRTVCESVTSDKYLYYSEFIDNNDAWSTEDFHKNLQIQGSLGDKISHAFKALVEVYNNILIIGSDCLDLDTEIIELAINALENNQVVIGPTYDGGYYLIGSQGYHPELFTDIAWSTESVCDQTLEAAVKKGLSVFTLPMLHDIDHESDWISALERNALKTIGM